jgi:hypothetical protein
MRHCLPPTSRPLFALLLSAATLAVAVAAAQPALARGKKAKAEMARMSADLETLRVKLMRYADVFAIDLADATAAFSEHAATPEARIQAATWRLYYTQIIWRAASEPRPYEALLDTLAGVTRLHKTFREHYLPAWSEAAERPVLEALARQERSIWELAAEFVTPEQLEHLREIVGEWLAGSDSKRALGPETASLLGDMTTTRLSGRDSGWLMSLIGLNTVDLLDPAVAEIEQTRLLAERALYQAHHLPELMTARLELMGLRAADAPETKESLAGWERVSQAAASIAATAEEWPQAVAAEREAAIDQVSREVTAQREGLLADFEEAHDPLLEILQETRGTVDASHQTLVAGKEMSQAFEETIQATDTLIANIKADRDPSREPRPFDITEYTETAVRFEATAHAVTESIKTLDTTLPELRQLMVESRGELDRAVDRVFLRAWQLLAGTLVGAALTTLAVRVIRTRWVDPRGARPL